MFLARGAVLFVEVHGREAVAGPAFPGVVGLHSVPYPVRHVPAVRLELLLAVDASGQLAPDIARRDQLGAELRSQACGTWQSAQPARTPAALVKCIESFHSASFHCIEWQEVQNSVVLVLSSTIEAPMEPANPASTSTTTAAAEIVLNMFATVALRLFPVKDIGQSGDA